MDQILYISGLCSANKINLIYKTTGKNPGFAMQKFNRLVATGFVDNGCTVETLSAPPVTSGFPQRIFSWKSETEKGVNYHYIPFINITGLRQLCLLIYSFFFILAWGIANRKNKYIVCDMLAVSINFSAIIAAKIVNIPIVGILTDMPGLMVNPQKNRSLKLRLATWLNKCIMSSYSHYVFLTKQMNDVVNIHHRPYIVMEGLVDGKNTGHVNRSNPLKSGVRRIVYAGGLFAEYGIQMLVEAFCQLKYKNISLDLFGDGPLVEWIKSKSNIDSRIIYHGIKPNNEVVEFEKESMLLVNPRPTHEKFTEYSFPSKNMEYMLSGTPVLTTNLPGMPFEYHKYVYIFESETVDGFRLKLDQILSLEPQELLSKGKMAAEWIKSNKNNIIQTHRILSLITTKS